MNPAKRSAPRFPYVKTIDLKSIRVDPRYQRALDQRRIDRMVKDFDANLCVPLVVNDAGDGSYTVTDGQHRLATLNALGVAAAECFVVSVSYPEEAGLFVRHQTERQAISTPDRHRAQVEAGEPVAVLLDTIVRSLGLEIRTGRQATGGFINAVASLYRVHTHGRIRGDAEDHVRKVLRVLKGAWGYSSVAYAGPFLVGMSVLLYAFKISTDELIERLNGTDPAQVLSSVRAASATSKSSSKVAALVILERMNKGRRSQRLDGVRVLSAVDEIRAGGPSVRGQTGRVTPRRRT